MKNKIYVIGIGPGDAGSLTQKAADALSGCDTVIGYTVYVDLIRDVYPEKEYLSTPMTQEVRRCEMAFEEAAKGKKTAVICSGDAGVYGMAGLMLEIGADDPETEVEILPGVTAALSGAAALGAPLADDFALISLSDRLTPWEKIEKRLRLAAEADFVICIYNPSSRGRPDTLKRACDVLLALLPAERLCGIAKNIGRKEESTMLCTLGELRNLQTDMITTIFIGNSVTENINARMVTPRGYRREKI